MCTWCGAEDKHYATLCPRSQKAGSLYDMRVRAGVITKGDDFPTMDSYRPSYSNFKLDSTGRAEKASEDTENGIIHGDRLSMMDFDHRHDVDANEPLHTPGKRSYSRHQSPWDGQRSSRRDNDQYSFPPYKRSRPDSRGRERDRRYARGRDLDEERGYDSRRDLYPRNRFASPTASRTNSVIRDNLELLPPRAVFEVDRFRKLDGHNDGRLSYWDDGYESPSVFQSPSEYQPESTYEQHSPVGQIPCSSSPSPLQLRTRSSAIGVWSDGDVEREIRQRFPTADHDWVAEMAGFDVDAFFSQMDDFMTARGTVSTGKERPLGMETAADVFDENAYDLCPDNGIVDMHDLQHDWSEEGQCTPPLEHALAHVRESRSGGDEDYEAAGPGDIQERTHEETLWTGLGPENDGRGCSGNDQW